MSPSGLLAVHTGKLRTEPGEASSRAIFLDHDRLCAEITVHHNIQESP